MFLVMDATQPSNTSLSNAHSTVTTWPSNNECPVVSYIHEGEEGGQAGSVLGR
jgi:hypothetical protein